MRRDEDTQPLILIIAPPQPADGEFPILLVAAMQGILALLDDVNIPGKLPDFRKLLAELPLCILTDDFHVDACSIENPVAGVKQN